MSETPRPSADDDNSMAPTLDGSDLVKLVYLLNFAGYFTGGLTTIIGVVLAYVKRGDASDWAETHYTYQIRTFWMSLLYGLVSVLLMIAVVGFFLIFAVIIWSIVRNVKGFLWANDGEEVPDPETWLW